MGTVIPTQPTSNVSVSIQLMSPASGDAGGEMRHIADKALEVSIQLMSPASGDKIKLEYCPFGDIGEFPFN